VGLVVRAKAREVPAQAELQAIAQARQVRCRDDDQPTGRNQASGLAQRAPGASRCSITSTSSTRSAVGQRIGVLGRHRCESSHPPSDRHRANQSDRPHTARRAPIHLLSCAADLHVRSRCRASAGPRSGRAASRAACTISPVDAPAESIWSEYVRTPADAIGSSAREAQHHLLILSYGSAVVAELAQAATRLMTSS